MVTVTVPEFNIVDKVELEANNTALIIVDMQNDFAHPDGKLFVPESRKIIEPIKGLLNKARENNVLVIYTMDTHMENDPEFNIWGKHTVKGTWGWEIIDELKPMKNDVIINNIKYDAFFGTPLDYILRINSISNLIITGTVSSICVLHTAGSAALRGYKIIVPVDAIASITEFDKYLTYRQVDFLYKGLLTRSNGIVFK